MSNTTIQLKYSTTPDNVPSSLVSGEIAINLEDGKLFYSNTTGVIKSIQNFPGPAGLNGEVQFNNFGVLGSNESFKFDDANNILQIESLNINECTALTSEALSTSSVTQTQLFSFDLTKYGSGKFVIQATDGSKRQVTEILVVHNGSTAYATEYAIIRTDTNLFNLDVDINSGNVRILTTSASSNTTIYKITSNLLLL
jgi:hypothetical protein